MGFFNFKTIIIECAQMLKAKNAKMQIVTFVSGEKVGSLLEFIESLGTIMLPFGFKNCLMQYSFANLSLKSLLLLISPIHAPLILFYH